MLTRSKTSARILVLILAVATVVAFTPLTGWTQEAYAGAVTTTVTVNGIDVSTHDIHRQERLQHLRTGLRIQCTSQQVQGIQEAALSQRTAEGSRNCKGILMINTNRCFAMFSIFNNWRLGCRTTCARVFGITSVRAATITILDKTMFLDRFESTI